MRATIALVCTVCCAVAARADGVDSALAALAGDDIAARHAAIRELADQGEPARVALERWLWPEGATRVAVPDTDAAVRERVAALIESLDAASYREREEATRSLVAIGKPAAPQLEAATTDARLEVARRAKEVLAAINPPASPDGSDASRVIASLLLSELGTRESVPALRHLLETGTPAVRAAAAHALRVIHRGGPAAEPLEWHEAPAKALAAWRAHFEGPGRDAPTGEAVELALPIAERGDQTYVYKARTAFRAKITGNSADMPMEGMPERLTGRGETDATFSDRIARASPPSLSRRYSAHRAQQRMEGLPHGAVGAPDGASWAGKELVVRFDDAGSPTMLLDDKPMEPSRGDAGIVPFGSLLVLELPSGRYTPGERRALPRPAIARLARVMIPRGVDPAALSYSAGGLAYLGSDRWSFDLHCEWLDPAQGSFLALALQGELRLDLARGALTSYRVSGPLVAEQSAKPMQVRMSGELSEELTESK